MLLQTPGRSKREKESISTSVASFERRVLYNLFYLFVVGAAITGTTTTVLPVILRSDIDAGPGSVYIPGAGFAGFWYHFGYFSHNHQKRVEKQRHQRNSNSQTSEYHIYHEVGKNDSTYYCYSSGCLGYVLASASVNIETVLSAAERVQKLWLDGHIHRYEVVPNFLEEVLPPFLVTPASSVMQKNETSNGAGLYTSPWVSMLSQLRILVTVLESGNILNNNLMRHHVHTPTSYESLIRYLQQTTHIPWLTGPITNDNVEDVTVTIDGGFSRMSHPICNTKIAVPVTWSTMIHSLNPGLDPRQAKLLFYHGMADAAKSNPYDEPTTTTTNNFNCELL